MYNFVTTFLEDNALYFINTKEHTKIDRISLPTECIGIRSTAVNNGLIYFCCEYTNQIWSFNTITKSYKRLCNTVGKNPRKLCVWHNFLIIACLDTDTVEICLNNGGQSFISHRLGCLLSDMFIYNELCICICLISSKIYVLSLPYLEIISVHKLCFNPFSIQVLNDEFVIIGMQDGYYGIIKTNKVGDTSKIFTIRDLPLYTLPQREALYLSCPFDKIIYEIPEKSNSIKRYKLKNSPQIMTFDGEGVLIAMHSQQSYVFTYSCMQKRIKYIDSKVPSAWQITSLTAL